MTKLKRGGFALAAPDAKRQQDVLRFFRNCEKDASKPVVSLGSTSASSAFVCATPTASRAAEEPPEVLSESGVGNRSEVSVPAGLVAAAENTGHPEEQANALDGFSIGNQTEAVVDNDGGTDNGIPAGQPSPAIDTIDLATFCGGIGANNFPRLTSENLTKLEGQFKEQTHRMQKQVDTMADKSLTAIDRKRMTAFDESTKKGALDPRSTMGGIFRAAMKANQGESKLYAGMTRADAAEYRMGWLKKEYKKFQEERVYSKIWKRVDTTKGKYLSASQLVLDDGGWSDEFAVEGAQKLIEKAIAMGDPWVRIHPQTGRTLFLKLNFEFEELFEESWSNFRKEINDGNIAGNAAEGNKSEAGAGDAAGNKSVAGGAVEGDELQTEGSDKGGAKPKPGVVPKPAAKGKPEKARDPQDKVFDEMWKQALANKKLVMSVVSAAREIDEQIMTSQAWSWAKNDQNQGKLTDLSKSLRAEMTEFHRGFLAEEPGTIRKRHTKELVMVELTNFNKLKDKMSAVGEFVKTLQRRHLS